MFHMELNELYNLCTIAGKAINENEKNDFLKSRAERKQFYDNYN